MFGSLQSPSVIDIVFVSVSRQYLQNIRVVDRGIERMTSMFEAAFDNDGQTAYVFTSDHGMTNWGMFKRNFIYVSK